MTHRDDPIIDPCLEELLGGRTPPDLSQRILRRWAESNAASNAESHLLGEPHGSSGSSSTAAPLLPPAASPPLAAPAGLPPLPGVYSDPSFAMPGAGSAGFTAAYATPAPVAPPVAPPVAGPGPTPPPVALPWDSAGRFESSRRSTSTRGRSTARSAPTSPWSSLALIGLVLATGTTLGLGGLVLSSGRSGNSRSSDLASGTDRASATSTARERASDRARGPRGVDVAVAPSSRLPSGQESSDQGPSSLSGARPAPSRRGDRSPESSTSPDRSLDTRHGSVAQAVPSDRPSNGGPAAERPAAGGASDRPSIASPVAQATPPAVAVPDAARRAKDAEVVGLINAALHRAWDESGVRPTEPATDAEWCRRAYLRILGRIPSVEEVDRYVAAAAQAERLNAARRQTARNASRRKTAPTTDSTPDSTSNVASSADAASGSSEWSANDPRAALIEELLGPRYAEEYASHWASIWANSLLGRRDANGRSPAQREGLAEYFRAALAENRSYATIASDLIAATGSSRREDPDFNPAVNFLAAHAQGSGAQAAGRVARVFLGARLQCAECHVHPAGSWSQDQLWQLASFFRQMKAEKDPETGAVRLVNVDFRGEGRDPSEAASYFELASGQLKAAFPVFLDGRAGSRSGLVEEADRRRELATFVSTSPQLAQTAVNRLWAHFLGYGFTQPIDDLGPHNRPSHPELLEQVASRFAEQGYDLEQLIRWVALSDAFHLSSKETEQNLADSPESGARPLFARYYSRPMQPEELSKSLQMLADARGKAGGAGAEQARTALLRQLGRALPSDDGDEQRGTRSPIAPSLIQVQRNFSAHAVGGFDGSLVGKVAANRSMSLDEKIEHLFQAALARKPSGAELQSARRLLADSPADVGQGLNDIWWVLLNSNEFILDH